MFYFESSYCLYSSVFSKILSFSISLELISNSMLEFALHTNSGLLGLAKAIKIYIFLAPSNTFSSNTALQSHSPLH